MLYNQVINSLMRHCESLMFSKYSACVLLKVFFVCVESYKFLIILIVYYAMNGKSCLS